MSAEEIRDYLTVYKFSDELLGLYGIKRDSFESEQSFVNALKHAIFKPRPCDGYMHLSLDKYCYQGMDYLPDELREPFLKAVNEGYEGKEDLKLGSYGLGFLNHLITQSHITYTSKARNRENYKDYTLKAQFEYLKDFYNTKVPLNAKEQEELNMACKVYEDFLNSIGDAANKAILRADDKSALYPPNSTTSFQIQITVQTSYQFIFQMSQKTMANKENLLFELLNPTEQTTS